MITFYFNKIRKQFEEIYVKIMVFVVTYCKNKTEYELWIRVLSREYSCENENIYFENLCEVKFFSLKIIRIILFFLQISRILHQRFLLIQNNVSKI